ncbi:MAG: class I SAM-dependent methyltransferase [Cyanobacteria bacterium]|nr:class I SAM-dependent methyltransferase [Cyanobacteriota bacterium]
MLNQALNSRSQKDQALFDNISEQYFKKDLNKASRIARKHRLIQTLGKNSTTLRVLELGCGAGFGAEYLQGHYSHYTGVDYSTQFINLAKQRSQDPQVTWICSDFLELGTDSQYDLIFMIGVLHHVEDIDAALRKCFKLLAPGGILVVNEPQPNNFLIHNMRKLRKKLDSHYSSDQEELESQFIRDKFKEVGLCEITTSPQGLFSTPFAEISFKPESFFAAWVQQFCNWDKYLEKHYPKILSNWTWNCIVSGQKTSELS